MADKNDSICRVEEFDPFRVRPLPNQPRKRFRGIPELAASIKEVGQAMPGVVTLVTDDPNFDAQLIDGERRLRACKNLGRKFRAEVREPVSDAETFVASFAANFGKQDHDAIEIAEGIERMRAEGKSFAQIAKIAGKSTAWVSQYHSFLKLHSDVQALMIPIADDGDFDETESVRPGKAPLAFQLAILLVPLPHPRQVALAKKICAGMSVAAARRLVLNERRDAGESERNLHGHGQNARRLLTIDNFVEDFSNKVGIYIDMPGAELARLIDAESATDRRRIMKLLDETAESLVGLSEAIKSRLPKMPQRAAG